jgi:catechol-2,3-dioxygenase
MTKTAPRMCLGHVGIHVKDIDRVKDFYTRVLGFTVTDEGVASAGVRMVFMSRNPEEHHQFVIAEGRPDGSFCMVNQVSFRVESLTDLRDVHARVTKANVKALTPIDHGNAWSLYFRDPEDMRVEVYMVTPWYIAQPHAEPLNLSLDDDELYRTGEAKYRQDPSFQPAAEWRKAFERKLAEPVPA